jgi:hypothetical protein
VSINQIESTRAILNHSAHCRGSRAGCKILGARRRHACRYSYAESGALPAKNQIPRKMLTQQHDLV